MVTQEEVGAELRAQLTTAITLATVLDSQAVTEIDDAGDAENQVIADALLIKPVIAVLNGTWKRDQLTAQGFLTTYNYDVLIYFVNVNEDTTGIDEVTVREMVSEVEKQIADYVLTANDADLWNSVDYGADVTTDATKTLAQTLFAASVVPLSIQTSL